MPTRRVALPPALAAAFAALALVVLTAGPAGAHARLLASDPADGASVDTAPLEVVLRFSEEVEPELVEVTDPTGSRVDAEPPAAAGDHVYTRLLPLTRPGTYVVRYRVISVDTDPVEGELAFTVSDAAVGEATAPAAGPPAPDPSPGEAPSPPGAAGPAAAPTAEPTTAPTPAPEPAGSPTPADVASELAAAPDDASAGPSAGALAALVAAVVVLAGGGWLLARRRGTPADTAPGPG